MSPFRRKGESIDLPCGKCYNCRARRVSGWSFRLMKEEERSSSSLFLTLTYAPEHVPLSYNGFMDLRKRHVQLFMKRLRKRHRGVKLVYYLAGEYGEHTRRPHYHMILFNAREEHIEPSWEYGSVHFGRVSGASIGYTLKYICKPAKWRMHKNDDRTPEFSLMSKGIGLNYITDEMLHWHHEDIERMYIPLQDGKKIPIPRILRKKIFTDREVDEFVEYQKWLELQPRQILKYFDKKLRDREWSRNCAKARKNENDTRQHAF